jgi:adenylate kinase
LLREAVAKQTPLGKEVESIMKAGQLVSDRIVLELIKDTLTDHSGDDKWSGWILDGYPRTLSQAEALEDVLSSAREIIDGVIVLDVDPEIIVERLSNRRTCVSCQAVYNLPNRPPKEEGKCDVCGGKLVQRDDDKPETIRKRLEVYNEQTLPILDLYEQRYDIFKVEGSKPIDDLTEEIVTRIAI